MEVEEQSSAVLDLMERMETVQALLNSPSGRQDELSIKTRTDLERELTQLRIKKTKTKSWPAQITVLEKAILSKTSAMEACEQTIANARAQLAVLQKKCQFYFPQK